MRRVILLSCFVLGLGVLVACGGNRGDTLQGAANLAVPTALAQENGGAKGCSIIGSWMTDPKQRFDPLPPNLADYNIPWMATFNGESSHSGTMVTMVPLWPEELPPGVKVTDLRGNWERTGGNTFKFTQVGWGVNGSGDAVLVFRNSGTTTLSENCSVSRVESTMEALSPEAYPLPAPGDGGVVFPPATIPPMTARRIVIFPPVLVPAQ